MSLEELAAVVGDGDSNGRDTVLVSGTEDSHLLLFAYHQIILHIVQSKAVEVIKGFRVNCKSG